MAAELKAGASPVTVNTKRRRLNGDSDGRRALARKSPEPGQNPQAWTLSECEAIFSTCAALTGTICGISRADYFLSLALVAYWTGERIGAVRSARSEDYDQAAGRLLIRWRSHKLRKDRSLTLRPLRWPCTYVINHWRAG
jgi:integrase